VGVGNLYTVERQNHEKRQIFLHIVIDRFCKAASLLGFGGWPGICLLIRTTTGSLGSEPMRQSRLITLVFLSITATTASATLIDRGGGLIYDTVLDVTWLQDANYGAGAAFDNGADTTDGLMTWMYAIAWADDLAYVDTVRGVTWTDWRLPTVNPVDGVAFDYADTTDGSTDEGVALQGVGYHT